MTPFPICFSSPYTLRLVISLLTLFHIPLSFLPPLCFLCASFLPPTILYTCSFLNLFQRFSIVPYNSRRSRPLPPLLRTIASDSLYFFIKVSLTLLQIVGFGCATNVCDAILRALIFLGPFTWKSQVHWESLLPLYIIYSRRDQW